ncbi:DUF1778 domain-containing protein [Streptosporangium sp. NPDC023615]|uniref:type II toxin-antitoxin system TacA family antitoxin n=1 Tax=Streptosporangium sp. NPDC023615 TaxID=3154794 RepID=UPI003428543A
MVMTVKTHRIEMRTDAATEALIVQAAEATGESTSSFVLRAARAEAGRVLARPDVTLMPAEQFDELLSSLDEPDDAPVLRRVARRRPGYHESA